MASLGSKILAVVLPKKKSPPGGVGFTNTYNPNAVGQILAAPAGIDHLNDLFQNRTTDAAPVLMQSLFKNDPDVSATVHAYLTVANTDPWFVVRDANGQVDRPGQQQLMQLMQQLFIRNDYTLPQPYAYKPNLRALCADLRYMLLMRGAIGAELVIDKTLLPSSIRNVDMNTIKWFEDLPGVYRPQQRPPGSSTPIDLNIPTFFTTFYRRDPTKVYTESPFIAAINTIAARQQIINDLYRIMRITGYPRIKISVVEEVLRKNAPQELQQDENEMRKWLNLRLADIGSGISNLSADQAISTFDSVVIDTMNKGGPSASMDVTAVIDVLNAQNQAALKVMATIIGRGEMGVNTASVEARVFSLSAEELNHPVAELLSAIFTFCLRLTGSQSVVEVGFDHVELRPTTELEPQLMIRQARWLELLSHGIVDDDEFHLEMFNKIRPDSAPELSGTGFYQPPAATGASGGDPAQNSGPLARSVTAPGGKSAKSNQVKKPAAKK